MENRFTPLQLRSGLTLKNRVVVPPMALPLTNQRADGYGGWRRPRDRLGEGYLVDDSSRILSETVLPVIGVGGIRTGTFIDEAIRSRKLSLAAVGRAILEDPAGWALANLA